MSKVTITQVDLPAQSKAPAEVLVSIIAGKLQKVPTRKTVSKHNYLHPQSLVYLKQAQTAEGSVDRNMEKLNTLAGQLLETYEE